MSAIVQGVLRPLEIIKGACKSLNSKRKVPTFNGVNQRVNVSWQQTNATSYIEMGVVRTQATDAIEYIADNTTSNNYIRFNTDGSIRCRVTETDLTLRTISTAVLNINQPYKLRLEFSPTVFEVFLDGVSQGSINFILPQDISGVWQTLAGSTGGAYGVVSLFDVDFNNETFYPLDDGWSNNPVVRNEATNLGSDLWLWDGEITSGTQWGNLYVDGVRCLENGVVEDGVQYLVKASLANIPVGGAIQLRVGTSGSQVILNEATPNRTYLVTAVGDRVSAVEASSDNTVQGALLNVSIQRADGYGQMVNGTEAMWSEANG